MFYQRQFKKKKGNVIFRGNWKLRVIKFIFMFRLSNRFSVVFCSSNVLREINQ